MTISLKANTDGSGTIYINGSPKMTLDAAGNITGSLTPAQGDNTFKLPTTAYVRQNSRNYAGAIQINSDTVLTAAHLSSALLVNTGGATLRLPAISSLFDGATFTIRNMATTPVGVITSGESIFISNANVLSSIFVDVGETAVFIAASGNWLLDGSTVGKRLPNFAKNVAGPSSWWSKLPNGLIQQWATVGFVRQAGLFFFADVTYPVPFPNACLSVVPAYIGQPPVAGTSTPLLVDSLSSRTGCSICTSINTWFTSARGDMSTQPISVSIVGW